jgi:hypothetical protein
MSKVLAVLLELKECSDYWSEYAVPIGIHERIDAAIAELLAQPEKSEPVAWMHKERELLERAATILKCYGMINGLVKEIEELLAQPEPEPDKYQFRYKLNGKDWGRWNLCNKIDYEDYKNNPTFLNWTYQTRKLITQPEQTEQEHVRYEYQDSDGEWQQFENKERYIDNQKWGEPTRVIYTLPQKREPLSDDEVIVPEWMTSQDERQAFVIGVRFAEKAHGIGADDE